MNWLQKL